LEQLMARKRKKGKVGRNDACPCGSGNKYKRCCLSKDKQTKSQNQAAKPPFFYTWVDDEMDVLDEMSNRIVDLVNAGEVDEAEQLCSELSRRRPDDIDCLDRLALVRRAQGRYEEAEDLFLQAAEFARTHPGFEPASVKLYQEKAVETEAMAKQQG
jgi:tetratricopeptide (TPR) repeat protein